MRSSKHNRQADVLRFLAIIGVAIAGLQLLTVVIHDISNRSDLYTEVAALAPVAQASIVECRTPSEDASPDETFVLEASEAGMAEVALGDLAKTKASSKEVKDFGKMMVTDHSKANDELKALAQKKNVKIPDECKMCQQKTKQLDNLTGKEFDKKFMEIMVADHNEAISKFSKESTQGNDNDLKTWAGQKLPTLRHHLEMAQKIKP
jgi:putative membrane protein